MNQLQIQRIKALVARAADERGLTRVEGLTRHEWRGSHTAMDSQHRRENERPEGSYKGEGEALPGEA